jgi:hypothetical protein
MYRKIIFISINLFTDMPMISKAVILLFFSFLSLVITFNSKPFLLKEMNYLEFYSNISASFTIFSGSLYITDINDYIKACCFAAIVLVNFMFAIIWLISLISITFQTHYKKFEKYFPSLAIKFNALKNSMSYTKYQRGSFIYIKEFVNNYENFKLELASERRKI